MKTLIGTCLSILFLISCAAKPTKEQIQLKTSLQRFEKSPVGTYEYEYVDRAKRYTMVVLNQRQEYKGETFFKVKRPDERDKYLWAIRISTEDYKPKVIWLIEGDPEANPGDLDTESNPIKGVDGETLWLTNSEGKIFGKLTRVPDEDKKAP